MSKEKKIEFQIIRADILESHLYLNQSEIDDFNHEIKIDHKMNVDNNLIVVTISDEIFKSNPESPELLAKFVGGFVYKVRDIRQYIDQNKSIDFPEDFLISINSISLSTLRGMMVAQFKGTHLHHAILPIVNPKSFVIDKKEIS